MLYLYVCAGMLILAPAVVVTAQRMKKKPFPSEDNHKMKRCYFYQHYLKLQHIVNCKFGQSTIFCAILML